MIGDLYENKIQTLDPKRDTNMYIGPRLFGQPIRWPDVALPFSEWPKVPKPGEGPHTDMPMFSCNGSLGQDYLTWDAPITPIKPQWTGQMARICNGPISTRPDLFCTKYEDNAGKPVPAVGVRPAYYDDAWHPFKSAKPTVYCSYNLTDLQRIKPKSMAEFLRDNPAAKEKVLSKWCEGAASNPETCPNYPVGECSKFVSLDRDEGDLCRKFAEESHDKADQAMTNWCADPIRRTYKECRCLRRQENELYNTLAQEVTDSGQDWCWYIPCKDTNLTAYLNTYDFRKPDKDAQKCPNVCAIVNRLSGTTITDSTWKQTVSCDGDKPNPSRPAQWFDYVSLLFKEIAKDPKNSPQLIQKFYAEHRDLAIMLFGAFTASTIAIITAIGVSMYLLIK